MDEKKMIHERIGIPALLEQTAEEAAELAHAALKLSRILRGDNPTPKGVTEATAGLTGEIADVCLCIMELYKAHVVRQDAVADVIDMKRLRWDKRLDEAGK